MDETPDPVDDAAEGWLHGLRDRTGAGAVVTYGGGGLSAGRTGFSGVERALLRGLRGRGAPPEGDAGADGERRRRRLHGRLPGRLRRRGRRGARPVAVPPDRGAVRQRARRGRPRLRHRRGGREPRGAVAAARAGGRGGRGLAARAPCSPAPAPARWSGRSAGSRRASGRPAGWTDGLGVVPHSLCPHYDTQPGRAALYRDLVADGEPAARATAWTRTPPRCSWAGTSCTCSRTATARACTPSAASPPGPRARRRPRLPATVAGAVSSTVSYGTRRPVGRAVLRLLLRARRHVDDPDDLAVQGEHRRERDRDVEHVVVAARGRVVPEDHAGAGRHLLAGPSGPPPAPARCRRPRRHRLRRPPTDTMTRPRPPARRRGLGRRRRIRPAGRTAAGRRTSRRRDMPGDCPTPDLSPAGRERRGPEWPGSWARVTVVVPRPRSRVRAALPLEAP